MYRQKSHAYFKSPSPSPSPPISHLHNSRSISTLPRAALRQSTLNQSRHSSTHQKSLTRSGIYLTTDNKRVKKDKEIERLYQQLQQSRIRIKELEEREIENYVLKKENQMFRLELEKIKEEIRIYHIQQQQSHTSHSTLSFNDTSKLYQLNNKYQTLSQHNLQNLKVITDLKIELNNYKHEIGRLKKEMMEQGEMLKRVRHLEGMCKRMEGEIEEEGRQWEKQKKVFVEILHAEIEQGKKKGW